MNGNRCLQECEESLPLFTDGGIVNICSHYEKLMWNDLKTINARASL